MSVSQYLTNSFKMVKDWSLDRDETLKTSEKPFHEKPLISEQTWIRAYHFLFDNEGENEVQYCKQKKLFIVAKKENTHYITKNFISGNYDLMTVAFDDFIDYNRGVRLVKLDRKNWINSTCTCGWYLKNYNCYHLIVVAVNKGLTTIVNDYKDVPIERKLKRGRKAKVKEALKRNHDQKNIFMLKLIFQFLCTK